MKTNVKKWGICLLATAVVAGFCYWLGLFAGFTSFGFAITLNFSLMTWTMIIVVQFKPQLNFSYFNTRAFEQNGQIYQYVGVHLFRKLLVWSGWERLNKAECPIKKNLAALQLCEYNTRVAELLHMSIAFLVFLITLAISPSLTGVGWLLVSNILLNVYPVFVQRYNRPRYRKLLERRTLVTV